MRNREEIKRYRTYLVCDQCSKGTKFVHDEAEASGLPDEWPAGWLVGSLFGFDGPSLDFCSQECTGAYFDAMRNRVFRAS